MKGIGQTEKALDAQKALSGLEKSFLKGSPAAKAAKNAAENDWLRLPLSEVAKATAGVDELKGFASWAENAQQSVRGLTQLGVKSTAAEKIRTVGQALAWDSFVAFNMAGEGDDEMDATFSDALSDVGLPAMPFLMTNAEDAAWARKAKQMVEGLAINGAMNGLIDTYRTYKFAQAFRSAKPTEQAQIMKAFGLSAQEIGDSMGRQIAASGDNLSNELPTSTAIRLGGKQAIPGDARAESIARMQADNAAIQSRVEANNPINRRDPWQGSATVPPPVTPRELDSLKQAIDAQALENAQPISQAPLPQAPAPAPQAAAEPSSSGGPGRATRRHSRKSREEHRQSYSR